MEEKNKIIISYIENRLQELDRMGMDVPENNVNKLYYSKKYICTKLKKNHIMY